GVATALLTSPSFDVVYRDLLLPLFTGAELHVPGHQIRTAPSEVLPWIIERAVQVIHAVPSLSARWIEAAPGLQAPSLSWTAFAGERLFDRHLTRWRAVAPNSRILNLYGPTETTLAAFCYRVPDPPAAGLQPVGQPLPDTRLSLEPVSEGGVSVTIETPYGSLGYLPDTCTEDDLLRLRRVEHLTRFRTQDRGRLDPAGDLVIEGRLDSLVKRHGSFVDTALVEAAAGELEGVRAACCVQVDVTGSGEVVLAVECSTAHTPAALRRALVRRLGFTMLPDQVVPLPQMPLLPSGKVDRRGVRALLDPDPS
ncbi:MAG: D-alanine--poly(phosphoribitol) ligase subunit 1, partial [Pseudonocardiales bacterium]|nr:D-alanine--poly(phosphoribitol) ligase subunit 1 [Pseudonocardiales bacterium]